mgnify:FL=1
MQLPKSPTLQAKPFRKVVLAVIMLSFLSFDANAQEGTYEIIDHSGLTDVSNYESAMDEANFDAFRYEGKRRTLNFKSGVKIELLSATEILAKGIAVDKSKAMKDNAVIKSEPEWELMANGYIRANYHSTEKKSRR